jgi:hypothetical protein
MIGCQNRVVRCVLFLAVALPLCAHDWLIVPGERVGPVTARSTEASLRAAFGAEVVRTTIQFDRTTAVPGVEIYGGRPNESLAVVWPRQQGGLWWPLVAIPCYGSATADCRWRTASGLRVGTSVTELENLNGKPFRLYPSSTLQAWIEPRWNDGKLARELGEDVELNFKGPQDQFFAGAAYSATNEPPLNAGIRRVNRMFVFLLSRRRAAPRNNWTIGGRFWPMLASGSVEQLRESLGPAEVHRSILPADEGLGDIPGVTIFGGQPAAEVNRRLDEDGAIFVCEVPGACRWRLAGDIPRKMTLAEAQKLNGRPFEFNGFDFDLGGNVTSWQGGRMTGLLGKARLAVTCEGGYPRRMVGDGVKLRSDDPGFRALECTVSVISF